MILKKLGLNGTDTINVDIILKEIYLLKDQMGIELQDTFNTRKYEKKTNNTYTDNVNNNNSSIW